MRVWQLQFVIIAFAGGLIWLLHSWPMFVFKDPTGCILNEWRTGEDMHTCAESRQQKSGR